MSRHVLLLAFALAACGSAPTASSRPRQIRLTDQQAQDIGRRIFRNEAGGQVRLLTHWNESEDFPSLGIGHFLWYVPGRPGPYTETFPALLDHLEAAGVTLPEWLRGSPRPGCPWKDRAAFYADFDGPRLSELRALLEATIPEQARFIAARLEAALPPVLAAAPAEERPALEARFYRVAAAPHGVYALVDYVNFKGEGVNPAERYGGQGWGLLQALQLMRDRDGSGAPIPPGQPSVDAFADAAERALERRVANAPPERQAAERRWLPAWRGRIQTYRRPQGHPEIKRGRGASRGPSSPWR